MVFKEEVKEEVKEELNEEEQEEFEELVKQECPIPWDGQAYKLDRTKFSTKYKVQRNTKEGYI